MKNFVLLAIIVLLALSQIASIALHSNGIAGYTNSPGETNCTFCHTPYPVNSPGGSVTINIPSSSSNNYLAGQTYTVNVKIVRAGLHIYGFGFESLDSTGASAGTLSLISSGTTTLLTALVNSNNRSNITHFGGLLSNDTCTFSFKWTAPPNNVGKVFFYTSGMAADGDGGAYGDYVYTASQILSPDLSNSVIDKKEIENIFALYPNPANTNFRIETINSKKITVDLYDANGRIVLSNIIRNTTNIDVAHLLEGIYTLSIKTGDRVVNKKLIIAR